jgi:hypothetical protein
MDNRFKVRKKNNKKINIYEMDKVSVLKTSAFRRDEALGYYQRVLDLATATLSNERNAVVLALYRSSVEEYRTALQQDFFREETEAMNQANRTVHRQFRGMKRLIQGMLLHPDTKIQKEAQEVMNLIKKYSDISKGSMDHRYGVLDTMMNELSTVSAEVQADLGIATWLEGLTLAIAKYKVARDIQRNERVEYQTGLVKNCRTALEENYRKLTNSVNAYAITFGDEEYASFIEHINAMIKVEKAVLKSRATRSEAKKEETDASKPSQDGEANTPETPQGGASDASQPSGGSDVANKEDTE